MYNWIDRLSNKQAWLLNSLLMSLLLSPFIFNDYILHILGGSFLLTDLGNSDGDVPYHNIIGVLFFEQIIFMFFLAPFCKILPCIILVNVVLLKIKAKFFDVYLFAKLNILYLFALLVIMQLVLPFVWLIRSISSNEAVKDIMIDYSVYMVLMGLAIYSWHKIMKSKIKLKKPYKK